MIVTPSTVIASSASINPGVIENSDLADDTITNAKVNSAAAIAQSKLALSIANAEVAPGAAIVDTKLAQITTASKVSGAALTLLANTPAGAGVIPSANIPAPVVVVRSGTFDRNPATTTDLVIAHGLGVTPSTIRISMEGNAVEMSSLGIKDSSGTRNRHTTDTGAANQDSTNIIAWMQGANTNKATITADATNFTLSWVAVGSPTGNMTCIWEAQA